MSPVKILHKDCDLSVANNRELPYDSYVVTYVEDGRICYDIVQPRKQMEIFDYYWDKYRENFKPPWSNPREESIQNFGTILQIRKRNRSCYE